MLSGRFIKTVHLAYASIIAEQNDMQGVLYPPSVLAEVRDSLKRALPQECLNKTTDSTIKRIKSSTIPEFKVQAIRSVTKRTTVFSKKSMMLSIPWTGRCIKAIFYIDDGLVAIRGFEFANSVSELIRNDLLFAGFAINNEKSDFNPKTKV